MKQVIEGVPKIIIEAVYKSKDGTWRGFCSPFDISCTADSQEKAMKKIDELVEVYMDGLKKYGYPMNLTIKELSDEEDKIVFEQVLEYVTNDITLKMKEDLKKFQLERDANPFKLRNKIKAIGTYSFLSNQVPTLV